MTEPIKVGVSACLLGEYVRYDGGYKYDRNITDTLGAYFTFVPVCPEVGCGLPTPREAMRLEGDPAAPRLMTCHTRKDMSEQMRSYSSAKIEELESLDLSGFVFKERSPSCGLTSVPIHGSSSSELYTVGLFARVFASCFQLMPMEEAERLKNPLVLENFVERIFQYRRDKNALDTILHCPSVS
jgi:uncharacterized protein YbbK (DUF523 family)